LAAGGAQGPWYLGLDHPGVIAELGLPALDLPGPGPSCFAFDTLGALYAVLGRVYELGISLPDGPLETFVAATKALPKATDASAWSSSGSGRTSSATACSPIGAAGVP
jgi:hypothetical protein